ncbi:MAG TPA: DUF4339 domain-containing protein [Roseimicrobium sp.]|nr:DUF4339 domain-containing protein [Roseimicrobium sp.]
MKKYYIELDGRRLGPFTEQALATQPLRRETLVWFSGMTDWTQATRVAELKHLFEPPQRAAQSEIGADDPPPSLPSVHGRGEADFLICNPALPKIAQFITLYAVVINPLTWLFMNATCCVTSGMGAPLAGFDLVVDILYSLWTLTTALAIFAGGLLLRNLRPSGSRLIMSGFSLNILGVIIIVPVGIAWYANQPEQPQDVAPPVKVALDLLSLVISLALLVLESVLLAWLFVARRRMRDILTALGRLSIRKD